jgi:hypothetical protein
MKLDRKNLDVAAAAVAAVNDAMAAAVAAAVAATVEIAINICFLWITEKKGL